MMTQRAGPRRSSIGGLRAAALLAASVVALAVALPAQAKPLEKERFTDTDTFEECGYMISAIQILEERFARGEIDGDEFEERRRVLESKAA